MSSIYFIILSIALTANALSECQKLSMCAMEKCIAPTNWTRTPQRDELMEHLIDRINFGCIYGPSCYDSCMECEPCEYGMKQIRNMIIDNKSDGQCKTMEKCALACFNDQVRWRSPWECFREKCASECFNQRSCHSCYDTMKNVFDGLCYREGYNYKFKVKCTELFAKASTELMLKKKKIVEM